MAYVASWIAPVGAVMGAKNWEQKPRNMDNCNQTFVKNETGGYYKPPFCQWPRGGSSKKETKYRIKAGEPVVKAGSYEYEDEGFYYGMGRYTRPKDDDEISIRTESTTLYMQSNLCTRTFGPNKKAKKLPGQCYRAQFHKRPIPTEYTLSEELKAKLSIPHVNIFDTVKYDGRTAKAPISPGTEPFLRKEFETGLLRKCENGRDIKPTTPQQIIDGDEEQNAMRRNASLPKVANPRTYRVGEVPRQKDRLDEPEEPIWRGLSKSASQILVSPRTYLHAKDRVSKGRKTVEDLYGRNEQVLYFD